MYFPSTPLPSPPSLLLSEKDVNKTKCIRRNQITQGTGLRDYMVNTITGHAPVLTAVIEAQSDIKATRSAAHRWKSLEPVVHNDGIADIRPVIQQRDVLSRESNVDFDSSIGSDEKGCSTAEASSNDVQQLNLLQQTDALLLLVTKMMLLLLVMLRYHFFQFRYDTDTIFTKYRSIDIDIDIKYVSKMHAFWRLTCKF